MDHMIGSWRAVGATTLSKMTFNIITLAIENKSKNPEFVSRGPML
jgi:hypothetical protein